MHTKSRSQERLFCCVIGLSRSLQAQVVSVEGESEGAAFVEEAGVDALVEELRVERAGAAVPLPRFFCQAKHGDGIWFRRTI